MLLGERNCATCTAGKQRAWGCDAEQRPDGTWTGAAIEPVTIDGEMQWRCPRRPVKDDPAYWAELFAVYRAYKNGILPDAGGIAQQSARGWTLLGLVETLVGAAEAERLEQIRQKG